MNEISVIENVTMTSLEMVEYINSQRKESEAVLAHSDFLKKVPQVLGEEVAGIYSSYYKAANGKQNPCYKFPKREACLMAMSYSYELQARVFDRMTAMEAKQVKTPLQLAREQVILYEQLEATQALLSNAIQTKAEIGTRREATAMNTASQAVKKVASLEIELDKSKSYSTIKRMEMLHHGLNFNWRILKSAGTQMGIDSIDVFDANYGTIKAYHSDVWMEAYAIEIN